MSTTTTPAPTATATTEIPPKREQEPTIHHDSQEEYESAEEIEGEYDEDDVEEIEIEEEIEEEEEVEEVEEEDEEEDDDGQEQGTNQNDKHLDDDEDRKNPQFIPKKGYFYEHDDRTKIEEENAPEDEEAAKKEEKPKKPTESANKWTHDKFDESEQAPKSREELTTAYGYDIRGEDQPPRARRRRRYGRGPTKYTRRWEEEEAYQKPRGGFRGRGRGFSRGNGRERRHDSNEYEDEFPELGDSSTRQKPQPKPDRVEILPTVKQVSSAPPPLAKRDNAEPERSHETGRRDHMRPGTFGERAKDNNSVPTRREGGRPLGRDSRDQERDFDNNYSYGGARGRGGGNRRRGRRNEFTNRNRYPNRRDALDDFESSANSNNVSRVTGNSRGHNNNRTHQNNVESNRGRGDGEYGGGPRSNQDIGRRVDVKDFRSAVVNDKVNDPKQRQISNDVRQDKPTQQQSHQPHQQRIPPFTNTEYPASGKYNNNAGPRGVPPSGHNLNRSQSDRQNNSYVEQVEEKYTEPNNQPTVGEPQKEVRDLREKLNAIRMQKGYQNQNDRRTQIPPRLQQQQQQQQLQQQQQQQQPQQIDQAKPRRYSTQRERPVQQQTIVTSGGVVIPNSAPAMAQGVPNIVPVVTMSDGVVPSTVAAYQPPNYYEGTQVYEASGSPVTGSGPSVSPSLWNPHASAYATAPYPSPPTAPQVPVPQPPYPDPTAFIGPGGPAIYAAPPQFIQDPTLMNYSGPAPPFPPPYHAHPQGFQGYAPVTPAPLPEVYHGGVTYYSTQNQMQRPPMMVPQKRPKSVLQLVEPPEKSKVDKIMKDPLHSEQPSELGMEAIRETSSETDLSHKMEEISLEPPIVDRKPSPLKEFTEETSWAAEMEELSSPTSSYPDGNPFGLQKADVKSTEKDKEVNNTSGSDNHKNDVSAKGDKSDGPEKVEPVSGSVGE